ncbi:unnamed protein product [Alternaria burnsii]|nr:unnamed protein product [Alternaria burnsii]
MNITIPTQSDLLASDVLDVDAASEAESVQQAWGNDHASSTSQSNPSIELEASVNPLDEPSTTLDANQTETAKPDDEEYGEFVQASTDPLKRPIYDTTEQDDETLGLLDNWSRPMWEVECYVGIGMVEPVTASIGMATRRVKQMARWKRNDNRANIIVAEWKRKRTQTIGRGTISTVAAAAAAAAAPSSAGEDSAQLATIPVRAVSNQYLQTPRATPSISDLNGVIRPVRFAGSAIDEMVETERTAWGP